MRRKFHNITNMIFASEAWALLTYGLIEFSNHNGAIGALALGFTLANLNLFPTWIGRQIRQNLILKNHLLI